MLTKGQKITNYTIDSDAHIGEGGFAYVYRAVDENDHKTVALKICKPSIDSSDITRFDRENEILHKLHSPKPHKRIILPYSKIINHCNYHCYTMEFAPTNLDCYLMQKYKLSEINKLEMFKKICEGVAYAHNKHHVVHRDLHWKNILMVNDDNISNPKLSDFGRAKNFEEQVDAYQPQTVLVHSLICPPENYFKIWKNAELEKYRTADIYALGVVLFFIFENNPTIFYETIKNSISKFIINENSIDISSLLIHERNNYYDEWLNQFDIDLFNYTFKIHLKKQSTEKKINSIIIKLCNPNYRKRYCNVDLLLKDLDNIQI